MLSATCVFTWGLCACALARNFHEGQKSFVGRPPRELSGDEERHTWEKLEMSERGAAGLNQFKSKVKKIKKQITKITYIARTFWTI